MAAVTRVNFKCSKCGITKKSGINSCCARGGAWFKKCGDDGDVDFDHTWEDGIQACRDDVTSISVKPSLRLMLRHGGVLVHSLYTRSQNGTRLRKRISDAVGTSVTGTMDATACTRLTKMTMCFCALSFISQRT